MKRLPGFRFDAKRSRRMKRLATLAIATALALPVAAADSPVRMVSEEIRAYPSPMVFDLDLPAELPWETDALKFVLCRNVTFGTLHVLDVHADALPSVKKHPDVFLRMSVKNNSGKDKRVRMSFANVGEGSVGCDVKVVPDETRFCGGGLVKPGPTVRVTITADDY
jgi:hypothetical protein